LLKAGGGIMNTVRRTRAAPVEQIIAETRARLDRMLEYGTTTAEAKTGYGLDTKTELKLLEAIYALDASHPIDLVPTFIGAHAIPAEFHGRADEFVRLVTDEMLPAVRAQSRDRDLSLPFCDVFCDDGAFDLRQSREILTRAQELGFPLKLHADEFANLGGAQLAAELGAVSADHLMVTRRAEMAQMADRGVIAVLLPGTTFGLGKDDFADGRAFIEENVPVALGSDLNPGTSWCESMPMIVAMATRYERLTTAEAIVAATLNAAYASGVGARVGSLEPEKQADLLIADISDYRYLAYRYGTNPIRTVIKRGALVRG
jgi:imidazolonepropionase